ncbi:glycoside hydrolase family 88 protein [Bifidobacterium oedipodis]|uniref:Glycosyl hydrolase family 88 n=1 Tax=Bifidobacterium oedipodis TaxID=2675322 RepID=A0A7Y0EPP5_9BIFI|nr:glycoside hydrolase family 88 protein [Bifidobacterium sp. DSM 109957]NMM94119.1 glycosyl hydrolase family 88 [Bifidobacterium sp. DSM 109957]
MTFEVSAALSDSDRQWVESLLPKLDAKFQAEITRVNGHIPYIANDGVYQTFKDETGKAEDADGIAWWTNGFWPGIMWQMFHATGNETYKTTAEHSEALLDRAFDEFIGLHHDVGFMWQPSAVANYKLTGGERSKARGMHAAELLLGRFNPVAKYIRSWNLPGSEGWSIIDSMINVQTLFWAGRETGDVRFTEAGKMHCDTLMNNAVRPDGSCNHITDFDPITGEVRATPGGQGYESGSSWSRGQGWAILGFALAARNTGEQRYLDTAKRVAHYFIANIALTDAKSLVDFRAPAEPVYWDALADVIVACGLIDIAEQVPELERHLYLDWAVRILKAVEAEWCDWAPERDGLVQMCTGCYHNENDREVPMMYGDYYFVEAVLHLAGKAMRIW